MKNNLSESDIMFESILGYFFTRFGLSRERKRVREPDAEDNMNDQVGKQRKLSNYTSSEDFLCPSPNWKNTKKQSLLNGPQRRNPLSRSEPAWQAESKENTIEISDNEDEEVVAMWQDTNTLRRRPVYRATLERKEVPQSEDDEIEVVKVVEPISKEAERTGSTIIQTPSMKVTPINCTTSRNKLLIQRPKSPYSSSSRAEDKKSSRLALNESFRIVEKIKYSELLQMYTSTPVQSYIRLPRYMQKRETLSGWADIARKEIIDLTKDERATLKRHVDVRKDREHEPSMSSNWHRDRPYLGTQSKSTGSDEIQVLSTPVKCNSLEESLKLNPSCGQDFVSSIREKYRQKKEALRKEEMQEKMKADHFKKLEKKFQMESLERLTNYLKITDAIVEDICIEEESKLPQLTPDMERVIEEALIPKPPGELLVEAFGLPIKRHDMQTLAGLNWLNDEVINYYMELLKERGKLENYPTVYAFNTFFYPRLLSGGHAALKRWTRKVDIFSFDLLIVPIHLGVHWCMAAVDFNKKTIKYYDSMGSPNNKCLQSLFRYLCEESLDKKKVEFDTTGWQMENVQKIPQQMNGSDCGVFSCMYAEYICRSARFTFTQNDMPYFRRRMVYEIIKQKLLM